MENASLKDCLPLLELKQLIFFKKQEVKILDVRSKEEFNENHIPGAIHLELHQLDMTNQLFDKNNVVVAVCGKGGGRSAVASDKLKVFGFKNSYWLCGGTFGWE